MTKIAVLLVVVSAFVHAGWNLLGKRANPPAALFLLSNAIGTALLLPVLVVFSGRLADVPVTVWVSLLATGFFQAFYYTSLAAAYRAGDMSVAYPVARCAPVVFTSVIVAVTHGVGSFSVPYAVGCALVIAGILLVPIRAARGVLPAAGTLFALCAAVGSTGYSMIDSAALGALRAGGRFTALEAGLFYLAVEAASSTAWMGASVAARRTERREFARALRQPILPAVLMSAGIYLGYGLVLVAMSFAKNVGYIVAFRQLSVPLGAALAIIAFREPAPAVRIAGIATATAGLALIAVG